jgi:hypothetical protein
MPERVIVLTEEQLEQVLAAALRPIEARLEQLLLKIRMQEAKANAKALGFRDAARYLELPEAEIRRAYQAGLLRERIRRGPRGKILFDKSELDRFYAEHYGETAAGRSRTKSVV